MAAAIGQGVLVLLHSLSQGPADTGRPRREKLVRPHPTAGRGSKRIARVNSNARGGQRAPALDGGSDELVQKGEQSQVAVFGGSPPNRGS